LFDDLPPPPPAFLEIDDSRAATTLITEDENNEVNSILDSNTETLPDPPEVKEYFPPPTTCEIDESARLKNPVSRHFLLL